MTSQKQPIQKVTVNYSDLPTDFVSHPIKKDLVLETNEDSVKQSLMNLLQTNYYERPYNPTIGTSIRKLLFEQMSPASFSAVKRQIVNCINNHEPRVSLLDVAISGDDSNGYLYITILYTINNSSITYTLNLSFDRVR